MVQAQGLSAADAARTAPAALILIHGRIYTLDSAVPWAEAIAISSGRIVAVGSDDEVLRRRGTSTRVVDLHGNLLTPGLIDSHVHFADGGWYLKNVALRDATTMSEVTRRVAQYADDHSHADWIQGEGWSYGYPDLAHGEFRKELLDRVSGSHPVFLDSSMAHAAWVNSEALRRAGITRDTANPAGGEIVHGADGEPTGWLKEESAIRLVQEKIPAPTPRDTQAALLAAIHEANRLGLTRVDSAGGDFPLLETLDRLRRQGRPQGGYIPEQRITVAEALRAYTLDAAYASRVDDQEGSIAVGKHADVVAFSHSFLEAPAAAIADARVLLTIVGGKIVYERK